MKTAFKLTKEQERVERLGAIKSQIAELEKEARKLEKSFWRKVGATVMGISWKVLVYERSSTSLSTKKLLRFITESQLEKCYVRKAASIIVSVREIK